MKKMRIMVSTGIYLCLCILFFTPLSIPHKVCLPVGFIGLASLCLTPWEISIALLLSAIGDYAGSCGNLIAQIGLFAAAHILYIVFFTRRYFKKVEPDGKLTARAKGFLMMMSFCILSLLALVFVKVVPAAPEGILQVGVGIYAVIICSMMLTAMLQRSLIYAMFVEPVPNADLVILSTYFAAQWLLFIRASPYKVPHPIHLLRF